MKTLSVDEPVKLMMHDLFLGMIPKTGEIIVYYDHNGEKPPMNALMIVGEIKALIAQPEFMKERRPWVVSMILWECDTKKAEKDGIARIGHIAAIAAVSLVVAFAVR